ncbi:MAG TPA: MgtC/SapB family protein [Steroidobacteraceae bacterium]|nr:MgtC/SapB family protein [Steroidobacteraceae bacterium]
MAADNLEIVFRLVVALVAGALIGFERSYQGRPAGIRTHALVCTASSLLMLVTAYETRWMHVAPDLVRLDPTRMAQGIMTGIGFLGAGVIFREGLSVRGLTTAASVWMTAAIGILAGIGFYFPLIVGVAITLGVLSLFRFLEERMPSFAYFHFDLKLARATAMKEEELRALVESHGFSIANFSYRLDAEGGVRRHSMVIRSPRKASAQRLAETLERTESVLEFRISPTGD